MEGGPEIRGNSFEGGRLEEDRLAKGEWDGDGKECIGRE